MLDQDMKEILGIIRDPNLTKDKKRDRLQSFVMTDLAARGNGNSIGALYILVEVLLAVSEQ